jgi:hypothetical protein
VELIHQPVRSQRQTQAVQLLRVETDKTSHKECARHSVRASWRQVVAAYDGWKKLILIMPKKPKTSSPTKPQVGCGRTGYGW